MKTLLIRRVANSEDGVFGCIVYENKPFALTLELPWKDNRRRISCVPSGTYKCKRVDSHRFGNTFEITNVPGRSHILFHKGNTDSDTAGCVLVGEQFGDIKGDSGILSSKAGYNEMMGIMKDESGFRLIIVDDWKTNLN